MKSKLFLILPWPLKCSCFLWIYFSKTTGTEGIMIITFKFYTMCKKVNHIYICIYTHTHKHFSTSWCLFIHIYIYIKCWTGGFIPVSVQFLPSQPWRNLILESECLDQLWCHSLCHSSFHSLKSPPKDSSLYLPPTLCLSSNTPLSHPCPTQWSQIPSTSHRLWQY